jgi:hypothetical protein
VIRTSGHVAEAPRGPPAQARIPAMRGRKQKMRQGHPSRPRETRPAPERAGSGGENRSTAVEQSRGNGRPGHVRAPGRKLLRCDGDTGPQRALLPFAGGVRLRSGSPVPQGGRPSSKLSRASESEPAFPTSPERRGTIRAWSAFPSASTISRRTTSASRTFRGRLRSGTSSRSLAATIPSSRATSDRGAGAGAGGAELLSSLVWGGARAGGGRPS